MRIVLRGRRTWLLWSLTFWSLTFLFVLGLSMSALAVAVGSEFPPDWANWPGWQASWSPQQAEQAVKVVERFRTGERAALLTLDDGVLAQLPIFATGEALDDVMARVAALEAEGAYQKLEIEAFAVEQVVRAGGAIEVVAKETHTLATHSQATGNVVAGTRTTMTLEVVYRLVEEAGRWKVAKVVATEG